MELAFDEAQHQARLAHGRLPQQHQLELADLVGGRGAIRPGSTSTTPGHGHQQTRAALDGKSLSWAGTTHRWTVEAGLCQTGPQRVAPGAQSLMVKEFKQGLKT